MKNFFVKVNKFFFIHHVTTQSININDAEKHYSELLKYFENNPNFFNEGDLEHFLAIESKMDLIFSELFCYFS